MATMRREKLTLQAVVAKLSAIAAYRDEFAEAFPVADSPLTYANLREAIAAFERTLRSDSRFDDFLGGDKGALGPREQQGLATFIRVNCVRCYDGPLVGGTLFEKLGAPKPYHNTTDQGRFEVTGKEDDRLVFKVASLRNAALTSPWFHDGSASSLAEVVRSMGEMQLDISLKDQEVEDIVAFLGALSGKQFEQAR